MTTWRTDPGTLIGSGEFLIDQSERKRKLKMERGKLWRHRAGVVWRVLGKQLGGMAAGSVLWFAAKDITLAMGGPDAKWDPVELFAMTFLAALIIGGVVALIFGLIHIVWDDWGREAYQEIKREWTP